MNIAWQAVQQWTQLDKQRVTEHIAMLEQQQAYNNVTSQSALTTDHS